MAWLITAPSRVIRSPSHGGTRPPCKGRSALPARLAMPPPMFRNRSSTTRTQWSARTAAVILWSMENSQGAGELIAHGTALVLQPMECPSRPERRQCRPRRGRRRRPWTDRYRRPRHGRAVERSGPPAGHRARALVRSPGKSPTSFPRSFARQAEATRGREAPAAGPEAAEAGRKTIRSARRSEP